MARFSAMVKNFLHWMHRSLSSTAADTAPPSTVDVVALGRIGYKDEEAIGEAGEGEVFIVVNELIGISSG